MYSKSSPVKNVIGVFQVVLQKVAEPLVIIIVIVIEDIVVVVVVVVAMGDAGLASDSPKLIKVQINGNQVPLKFLRLLCPTALQRETLSHLMQCSKVLNYLGYHGVRKLLLQQVGQSEYFY